MTTVVRCWIKNLEYMLENTKNSSIIGVIVAKSLPKIFAGIEGNERGVLNMTLRDSARDTINCTIWGTKDFIESINDNFTFGQVVDVVEPRVTMPDNKSSYQPSTSSPYVMTINDGKGKIMEIAGSGDDFKRLLRVPLKPLGLTLSLGDVDSRGELVSAEFVDLLVVVRMIRPIREIKTRAGRITYIREIVVMDKSFPGMLLIFWGKECNERIDLWKPLETCLHLCDIKSDYSSFHRTVVLTHSSRTIILENINVPEVQQLIAYAANVPPIDNFFLETSGLPHPDEIRCIMSVQQILDRAEGHLMSNEQQFTALIYVLITKFDLDGYGRFVTERCPMCKQVVVGECQEANCVSLQFQEDATQKNTLSFEILMDLSDHTGTLPNCRLMKEAANKLLEISPETFLKLSSDQKTQLKWKTLLQRCAVKVVVRKKSVCRPRMWIGIVECFVADPEDVTQNIKVY